MELKKNPKADLEKSRGLFLEIGLVAILAVSLVAFEWKTTSKDDVVVQEVVDDFIDDDIIVQTAENTPPPPPPPEVPEVQTVFEVVEDTKKIENELVVDAGLTKETQNTEIVAVQIEQPEEVVEEKIFTFVEQEPSFPGGPEAMHKYLVENIRYPDLARETGISGKVYIQFVVERDGSIANPRVVRDIGGGCGAEALRVVKSMPKWTPGKQSGRAVRVQFNLPVSFNLRG